VLPAAAAEDDDDDITDSDEDRKEDREKHTARVLRRRRRDTLRAFSDGEDDPHCAWARTERMRDTLRVRSDEGEETHCACAPRETRRGRRRREDRGEERMGRTTNTLHVWSDGDNERHTARVLITRQETHCACARTKKQKRHTARALGGRDVRSGRRAETNTHTTRVLDWTLRVYPG
jgi:hypothetical protein